MSFTEDFATAYSKKYAEFDSFWKQNEQRLRDIQKFEGLKGVTYDFLNASHAQAASLADAQAEIARLRGALEEARRRVSDDLLGADSQDRRIMEEIDDAITVALDTK